MKWKERGSVMYPAGDIDDEGKEKKRRSWWLWMAGLHDRPV
jgi:hypothetical protein